MRPSKAINPASIKAETIIAATDPPAVKADRAGEGVGVAGRSVAVDVTVEVGQSVMVGGMVGVDVGWVGVGVLTARIVIFWFTKMVDLIVSRFSLRISAKGTL